MNMENAVRWSLWLTAPLNILAAISFAFPDRWVGSVVGLPAAAHPLYTWLSAALVALFGVTYAWLALQKPIVRPVLMLGAIGKLTAVVLTLLLLVLGHLGPLPAAIISGDLVFVVLWARFLWRAPTNDLS